MKWRMPLYIAGRMISVRMTVNVAETATSSRAARWPGASRERAAAQIDALPERLRSLDPCEAYPVDVTSSLRALAADVDART
jgi:hypothetical protein